MKAHRYAFLALVTAALPQAGVFAQPAPAALPPTALPAASAAATMLPAVTVPTMPTAAAAPAGSLPAMPTSALPLVVPGAKIEPAPVITSITEEKKPISSMGTSNLSVFFTPLQTRAMQDALEEYESRATGKPADANLEIDLTQKKEVPKLIEPDIYPVFYLSSIVYHGPKDWSIWVSGHKITSAHNSTDLTVLSVSESQASFAWHPTFNKALVTRKSSNSFAPTDAVKNKLTKASRYTYDPEAGAFTFTLGTNQTFNVAYMNTFEGFVESPKLPALPVEAVTATGESGPITAPVLTPPGQTYVAPPLIDPKDGILGTHALKDLLKQNPKN